jgi:hypothetical protein
MSLFSRWFGAKVSATEKTLLLRCRGDEAQLERLIQLEAARRPGLSRAACAHAALERWARDR